MLLSDHIFYKLKMNVIILAEDNVQLMVKISLIIYKNNELFELYNTT